MTNSRTISFGHFRHARQRARSQSQVTFASAPDASGPSRSSVRLTSLRHPLRVTAQTTGSGQRFGHIPQRALKACMPSDSKSQTCGIANRCDCAASVSEVRAFRMRCVTRGHFGEPIGASSFKHRVDTKKPARRYAASLAAVIENTPNGCVPLARSKRQQPAEIKLKFRQGYQSVEFVSGVRA